MTDAPDTTGGVLRWIAGAVVPMFARPTRPAALAWVLHVLLVLAVVVGGYFVQKFSGLNEWLPDAPDVVRDLWLPGLLLLMYALLWAAGWLWAQLAPEQAAVVYPDLDEAWATCVEALQRAGIGVADTPVFLVIGELTNGFEPLFRGLPRGVAVAGGTPSEAAVRVFANADAIYVTLSGATLLGVQAAGEVVDLIATGGAGGDGDQSGYSSVGFGQSVSIGGGGGDSLAGGYGSMGASVGGSMGASMAGGGPLRKIQKIINKARSEGRDPNDAEKEEIRALSANSAAAAAPAAKKVKAPPVSVLHNPELVGEAEARLDYICKKVAGSRWPLCPVNGLILAVPVSALESEGRAVQWGAVARQDLGVIEAALRLRFPVFALLGGMEQLPGGELFFGRLSKEKSHQRLGKGFPLNPDGEPEQVKRGIESTAGWVLGGLLPYWALKYTRVNNSPTDTDDNAGAVKFLTESSRRGQAFGRLLAQAVAGGKRTPTFGGCYLVVGSVKDPNEAHFARDFFKKVELCQAAVAWTDDAYATDATYRRWQVGGYVAAAGIVLAVLALAVFVFVIKK